MNTINPNNLARRDAWKWRRAWPLERWLQVSVGAMAVLGTLLLGMGKRDYMVAVLAAIVAASAVYLVDVKCWVRVNLLVANIVGLLLGIQLWYVLASQENKLVALADSLVYLQFVLLFCTKTTRIYWYLALLSLLQVAVASAINLGVVFAFVLLVYVLVTLMALALFYLVRESQRFDLAPTGLAGGAESIVTDRRWPLAGRAASFSGRGGEALDRSALRALARKTAAIALGSVVTAAAVFMLMPRLGHSSWSGSQLNAHRVVGFSDSVTLGALGSVTDNPEEVMTARFTDGNTGDSYRLSESPLFRGAVLSTYRSGEWLRARTPVTNRSVSGKAVVPRAAPAGQPIVEQTITIEPLETPIVFSLFPALVTQPNDGLLDDPDDAKGHQFFRNEKLRQQRFEYRLSLPGIREGQQLAITPVIKRLELYELDRLLQLPSNREQGDPLAGLKDIADQEIDGIPAADRLGQARALERFLRDTGGFAYSLQPVSRDPTLDPVEDFVTNNRRGHCEYFATALALMLRSVQIPARVVVGFRGDEYNSLGDFYQVRQLHAHAWVEAYLEPDDVAGSGSPQDGRSPHGGWLRLDPTASTSAFNQSGRGWLGLPGLSETLDFCQFLWTRYVLGMDASRQRQTVYGPVASAAANIVKKPFSADTYTGLGQGIRLFFHLMIDSFRQGRWFNWRGGLTAVVILLATVAAWRSTRWAVSAVKGWLSRERSAARRELARRVEFYHRMETLLARHKIERAGCQTQREFAINAGGKLAEQDTTRTVADVPSHIAELFYRIRFGGRVVEGKQLDQIRQSLGRLRASLEPGRPRRRLRKTIENE